MVVSPGLSGMPSGAADSSLDCIADSTAIDTLVETVDFLVGDVVSTAAFSIEESPRSSSSGL